MARIGNNIIDTGDEFPNLTFKTIDGQEMQLSKKLIGSWNVILFYRGFWCPFCKSQLKSFQTGLDQMTAEGIEILAVSVDPLEKAEETQKETGAIFPIAYGAPVKETAESIGAFYDAHPAHTTEPYLQSTGFVVAPDGKVVISVYSSGAIGRLVWQDVLGLVKYMKTVAKK